MKKINLKKSQTMEGTNWFPSISAARSYYFTYGYSKETVSEKIKNDEIVIGMPPQKEGFDLVVKDCRWHYIS